MRSQFVAVRTRREAIEVCPWVSVIARAEGGWWCFESVEDARIWANQK